VLKLKGKHFIDPKMSEILSVFKVFPCTMQISLFMAKTAPCPFPEEASISLPAPLKSWQKHHKSLNHRLSKDSKQQNKCIFMVQAGFPTIKSGGINAAAGRRGI
jgi:hypothetical protein